MKYEMCRQNFLLHKLPKFYSTHLQTLLSILSTTPYLLISVPAMKTFTLNLKL